MRAVSPKRAADNRTRSQVVAAMRLHFGEQCARCGTRGEVHGHEALPRSQGGDPTNPDCLLCNRCNVWCEDNPIQAAWTGWKRSGKHPQSPDLAVGQALRLDGEVWDFTDCRPGCCLGCGAVAWVEPYSGLCLMCLHGPLPGVSERRVTP